MNRGFYYPLRRLHSSLVHPFAQTRMVGLPSLTLFPNSRLHVDENYGMNNGIRIRYDHGGSPVVVFVVGIRSFSSSMNNNNSSNNNSNSRNSNSSSNNGQQSNKIPSPNSLTADEQLQQQQHQQQYSSSSFSPPTNGGMKSMAYVHPLSQIILEYLQDCRHEWVIHHGLDQSLTLHRDGSFVLKFGATTSKKDGTTGETEQTTSSLTKEDTDDGNNKCAQQNDTTTTTTSTTTPKDEEQQDDDKIWTSYDEEEKKHWLTVQKQSVHQRFLLQDNMLPAWHGNKKSLPERIHLRVDAMIRAVDRLDGHATSPSPPKQQQQQQQQQQRHGK
ncbi:hypothetical protein IV203_016215 [Nitzschia inconspicua]|uniref:Uncharacterized protein n=1 Tax=Nitzschia inconspicua TaxID=303405 RepID=A0A9K3KPL4_9STRA|nr:hypothetical protein IV203_016215 [Nitzschia inconspicua]